MKKVLILKTGGTIKSLIPHKGDFEDWIITGMKVDKGSVTLIDVRNNTFLPNYEDILGIVITGSHSMLTKHHDWNERTAKWLPGAVEREIPVLGICYGHQLLAYALGGEVKGNSLGSEYGTVEILLTESARKDRLFKGLPKIFKAHVTHSESVTKLPEKAKRLASSNMDANQAFSFGKCAWGVQFHPEYDTEVVAAYINTFKDILLNQNQDINDLLLKVSQTPQSFELLTRFADISNNRK